MTFGDSIQTCVTKKYATFEGRAGRSEYWWFYLAYCIGQFLPLVNYIVIFGGFIPVIAVGVRRLHDTGHSGWWLLCPIYNIILLATPADPHSNEYGPAPID